MQMDFLEDKVFEDYQIDVNNVSKKDKLNMITNAR
jgi:hypothetical protein